MNVTRKVLGLVSVCAVACSAAAADWLYVPASYTDQMNNTWGTISDGTWTLCVTASGTELSTKGEGTPTSVPPLAVTGTGALDLSKPIYDADGTRYTLIGQRLSAFWKFASAYHTDPKRGITSYISSPDFQWIARNAFNTASDLGNVVLDSPLCQYLENQAFFKCTSLTNLVLNLPSAGFLGYALTLDAKIASDASQWRLDSVTNVQPRAFHAQPMTGALYLPNAAYIDHQAFISCTRLKGLVLGSENPTGDGLIHVGANAAAITDANQRTSEQATIDAARAADGDVNKISVGYGLSLDFLVIGKGKAVHLDDYAFSGITCLNNLFFCGDRPTFGTTVFRHLEEKGTAIYIPYGNETYAQAIASVTEPTPAERAEFEAHHAPGTLIGMVNGQTYFGGNANRKQFLAYGNYRQYLNDIVVAGTPTGVTRTSHPDLYWDCNRTVRDVPAESDYALSAPASRLINGSYRFVSGYTLETATPEGWSAPQTHAGTTYVRPAGTKGTVRVTWLWRETTVKASGLAFPDDPTWPGDAVKITDADGTEVAANDYVRFGEITLTPVWTAADGYPENGFFHWENLPAGAEVAADGRVTFMYDGTQAGIRAVFRHDWVYDAAAGTIFNRRYRLNVTALDEDRLALGTADSLSGTTAAFGNAFRVPTDDAALEAGGHLDLNGRITAADGTGSWRITDIGYRSLSPWALTADDPRVATSYPPAVRLPETLVSLKGATFKTINWDYTPLTNLVVVTPFLKTTGKTFAEGHRNLFCLHLDCPALETMEQAFVCASSTVLKFTDVTSWHLPNLTTLNPQPFGNNCTYPSVRGTLDLPKLTASSSQGLSALTGVETMILGTNGWTVTTFGQAMFEKCSGLKHLTIGADGTVAFPSEKFFPANTALESLTFYQNKMPVNVGPLLDAVLSYKTVKGPADYVTVTGSKTVFKRRLTFAALTEAEAAVAPAGTFGVYVTSDTAARKA